MFPTAVRGQAAAFCAMIDWLADFLLIEVFPVCFAALAVEDIVQLFEPHRQAAAERAGSLAGAA